MSKSSPSHYVDIRVANNMLDNAEDERDEFKDQVLALRVERGELKAKLARALEALKLISKTDTGRGYSDYAMSGYKSHIATEALRELEAE